MKFPVARLGQALLLAALAWVAPLPVATSQTAMDPLFDHYTTGWPLEGHHRQVPCSACHVAGIFAGTPTRCGACHARGSLVNATAPPVNHIRSTDECDACHRDTSWSYVRAVDHNAVAGTCFSCHNGQAATGKPPTHVPTSSDCDVCHRVRGWVPTR
jgi:hypothetical protein